MLVQDAVTELLRRIRELDQEESMLRREASNLVTSANYKLDQADRMATTRRQYEFAVSELGEDPAKVPTRIPVASVETAPRTVHVNAVTPA
jgi:hypothetical protein